MFAYYWSGNLIARASNRHSAALDIGRSIAARGLNRVQPGEVANYDFGVGGQD